MKIFGIGLNKTGTKTLGACLKHFCFRHTSHNLELTRSVIVGTLEKVFNFVYQYDSFEDWPWPLIYKELDQNYLGSKFILTTRISSDAWMKSLLKHSERTGPTEYRKMIYGLPMPQGHEAAHIAKYEVHNEAVRQYFASRSQDFLEVCWETGSGWKELCAFLNQPIPNKPFPHANKSPDKDLESTITIMRSCLSPRR